MVFEKKLAVQIDMSVTKPSLLIKKAVNSFPWLVQGNEKKNRFFPWLHRSHHAVHYIVTHLVSSKIRTSFPLYLLWCIFMSASLAIALPICVISPSSNQFNQNCESANSILSPNCSSLSPCNWAAFSTFNRVLIQC